MSQEADLRTVEVCRVPAADGLVSKTPISERRFEDCDEPTKILTCRELTGQLAPLDQWALGPGSAKLIGRLFSQRGVEAEMAPYLLVVGFSVPKEAVARFDDWYETEHSGLLLEADGWLRIRRYVIEESVGVEWTHMAIHELATLKVLDSPERERARNGPKRLALADEFWYALGGRWLGRVLS